MKNERIYKICEQKLYYLNYSKRTISIYLHYIEKFLNSIDVNIQRINSNDFQSYLDNYNFTSVSQQNQIINAIRFLYKYGLNKKYNKVSFKRPRKEKKLPTVIDTNFILEKLSKIENLKHKAILSIAYSVGLRVSEVINLKIEDIDSNRMVIHIKNAKGRKDRIVPLSDNILTLLRKYYKKYQPVEYLFNGQNSLQYSSNSCNKIVKRYIGTEYHMHILRHSCFTHLLESGVDLRIIQEIAGHNSSKTTEIYTHVSKKLLNKVLLPI
jgi:integrase/recombinase XerD